MVAVNNPYLVKYITLKSELKSKDHLSISGRLDIAQIQIRIVFADFRFHNTLNSTEVSEFACCLHMTFSTKQLFQKYLSYWGRFIPKCSKYNANFKYATQTCKYMFCFQVCSFD